MSRALVELLEIAKHSNTIPQVSAWIKRYVGEAHVSQHTDKYAEGLIDAKALKAYEEERALRGLTKVLQEQGAVNKEIYQTYDHSVRVYSIVTILPKAKT